jgi:hypothetical protein
MQWQKEIGQKDKQRSTKYFIENYMTDNTMAKIKKIKNTYCYRVVFVC